jgi:hypothetical protein
VFQVPGFGTRNSELGTWWLVLGDLSNLQNVVYWILNIQFLQLILNTQYLVISLIYEMLYSRFWCPEFKTWHPKLGTWKSKMPRTWYLVFSIRYAVFVTRNLVHGDLFILWNTQNLIFGIWYLVFVTWNSELGTWWFVHFMKYLELNIHYQELGTLSNAWSSELNTQNSIFSI